MIELILAVFATYRVARMLATEEGFFGIFDKVRERFDPLQTTWVGRGLNCPMCIGFWIALICAIVFVPPTTWQTFVLHWLAIAGGQVLLQLWSER